MDWWHEQFSAGSQQPEDDPASGNTSGESGGADSSLPAGFVS